MRIGYFIFYPFSGESKTKILGLSPVIWPIDALESADLIVSKSSSSALSVMSLILKQIHSFKPYLYYYILYRLDTICNIIQEIFHVKTINCLLMPPIWGIYLPVSVRPSFRLSSLSTAELLSNHY